jgi:hypothetical protein
LHRDNFNTLSTKGGRSYEGDAKPQVREPYVSRYSITTTSETLATSATVGVQYAVVPDARDADRNALAFKIKNKPARM